VNVTAPLLTDWNICCVREKSVSTNWTGFSVTSA